MGEPSLGHFYWISSVCYSPDGKKIVTGGWDKMAIIWDAKKASLIGDPLQGHLGPVYCVGFSPDGKLVVTGG